MNRRLFLLGLIVASLAIGLVPRVARADGTIPFTITYDAGHDNFGPGSNWHAVTREACTPIWDGTSWFTYSACASNGVDSIVSIGLEYPNTWGNVTITTVFVTQQTYAPTGYYFSYNGGEEWDGNNTHGIGAVVTPNGGIGGYALTITKRYDHAVDLSTVTITGFYEELPPTFVPLSEGVDGTCKMCVYTPSGDWSQDAVNLINFLACQLSNIYYCHIIPILLGIWRTLFRVLLLFQASFFWLKSLIEQSITYISSMVVALAYYVNGSVQNGATRIINSLVQSQSAYFIQGSGANLWDVIVAFFNNVGGVFTSLLGAIQGLGTTIVQALQSILHDTFGFFIVLINAVVSLAGLVLGLIATLINAVVSIINLIMQMVMIVPRMIASFQVAISAPTSDPLVGLAGLDGFTCSNIIVRQYCLGAYVLDNTVFSSSMNLLGVTVPIIGTMLQIMMFLISADRMIWALRKFQKLGGSGSAE